MQQSSSPLLSTSSSVSPFPAPAYATSSDSEFPPAGDRLLHVFYIASTPDSATIDGIRERLRALGAPVTTRRAVRSGDQLDQIVQIHGVSQTRARKLREDLQQQANVLRVRLEHVYLRTSGRQGRPSRNGLR